MGSNRSHIGGLHKPHIPPFPLYEPDTSICGMPGTTHRELFLKVVSTRSTYSLYFVPLWRLTAAEAEAILKDTSGLGVRVHG